MASKVAVVVPHHKEELNIFEQISLAQLQKVLGRYPIIFAVPEGANFSWIPAGRQVIQLPFLGRGAQYYNILFMSTILYSQFLEYDYILIYHLDAFVFSDKLEYFCELGYDNIGAPWPFMWAKKTPYGESFISPRVGNGGFCLRRVRKCFDLLSTHPDWAKEWIEQGKPEDVFWSYYGTRGDSNFRTAPISVGYQFAAEFFPERVAKKNGGELPFGCHAFHNFSANFYVENFLKCGYDIRKLQKFMLNSDGGLKNWLINLSVNRLVRRINTGKSLTRYLPQNRYASIRAIRHPLTMLILARLILENNNISDKIYFYDESELDILIHDCQPEKLPHLLITTGGGTDINLTNALEKSGLAYGKRVVSFQREYMAYCENLFHNLGK